jgi:hypothetical protein
MFQWARIPDLDVDLTASADTTETQIGTGIRIPNWAKSIIAVRILLRYLALTTQEEVCGYLRLNNDENTIEPLYLPLPIAQTMTGAIGTHFADPIVMPVEIPVTPNDILRAYTALDAATTGSHTMVVYVCFSSRAARFKMHSQKSAVQTLSTASVTRTTVQTISTIAGRTSGIIGVWGYIVAGGNITAAESCTGYVLIESNAAGWLTQRLPLNLQGSGLSTQITPFTRPVISINKDIYAEMLDISGLTVLPFPDIFPVATAENFNFYGMADGGNTAAPTGRYGLIFKE